MTSPRVRPRRGRSGPARGAWLAVLVLVCLPLQAPAAPHRPQLDRESRALAERLYAQLEQARAERRDRAVLELAFELVDRYPRFADNDRVLLLAVRSARQLGDLPLARQLLGELRDGWPASPLLGEAATLADSLGAPPPVVGAVAGTDAGAAAPGTPVLPAPVAPVSVVAPAPATPAAGPGTSRLPPEFAPVWPAPLPPGARTAEPAPVDPGLIGVICPLSGEAAAVGAAFAAGAQLAAAHAGRDGWRQVRLRVVDSGGDPAAAALAARRLAVGEGIVALVGAVGAGATAAVAAVADAWRVPFVAPAGDSPALRDFSPDVVATDLLEGHDARLLARLAVGVTRRPRAAVLYPDTPEGARACAAFVLALRETGGRLVATAACAPDGAVAEATLRGLAEARPEALYLPLSPAAAVRLAPRLAAASCAGLLLGPSIWDRPGAVAVADSLPAGTVCAAETAVWPRDWVEAFTTAWPAAAPAGAGEIAARSGRQAYLAVRLVVAAMADCGLSPTRETLATTLGARWLRLSAAPVGEVEAVRGARLLQGGRWAPYAAPAAASGP